MKQLKGSFDKIQTSTNKHTYSNSIPNLAPYDRLAPRSLPKHKPKNEKLRSNTLSLARKIESSLSKGKAREAESRLDFKRLGSEVKTHQPSRSHSHFTSINDKPPPSYYLKNQRKTELSKPKTHREELRRIIQALKQRQQRKTYKDDSCKKNPSSKTLYTKGKSSQHSAHRSVHVQVQAPVSISYAYRTRQGVLSTNPSKPNQDSLLIKSRLSNDNNHLFAVADGHGLYGHLVSQFVAKNLSKLMQTSMKTLSPTEAFKVSFTKLQQLLKESDINAECSGTTLVSLLMKKNDLFCANVGDSRAIIVSQNKKKSWEISELSRDHKPDIPSEKERILKQGGRVEPFRDQNGNSLGPMRVWLPKQNIQGLAMSRSLGDNVSKSVGVTCQPEIINYKMQEQDKFIIMGSDGLWEFIDNQEAARLVLPFYKDDKLEEGIDGLMKLAYERWTSEDSSVVDDITVLLIFLNK